MKYAKLAKLWDSLHSSFWFVPSLMVLLAIALSFITIWIDHRQEATIIENIDWAYSLGPSGSRAILSAIALFTNRIPDRTTLQRHADMIERGSQEGIAEESDYNNVKERYLAAVKAISQV
ncbi:MULTISPECIES: DUF2254 family protein [Spirulina sp. CCY15215]|uniref:DUF2254 family protein n=1 Tax=Spirulina sp. CCY15215 TaxID=2767591 RepID=UPI00194DF566|nr:DUF2254 family protein [Spirulina major]